MPSMVTQWGTLQQEGFLITQEHADLGKPVKAQQTLEGCVWCDRDTHSTR